MLSNYCLNIQKSLTSKFRKIFIYENGKLNIVYRNATTYSIDSSTFDYTQFYLRILLQCFSFKSFLGFIFRIWILSNFFRIHHEINDVTILTHFCPLCWVVSINKIWQRAFLQSSVGACHQSCPHGGRQCPHKTDVLLLLAIVRNVVASDWTEPRKGLTSSGSRFSSDGRHFASLGNLYLHPDQHKRYANHLYFHLF